MVQSLYAVSGTAVLKGKTVDPEKTFVDLQIKESDKILIIGSLTKIQ
jgi:hypothetical protein